MKETEKRNMNIMVSANQKFLKPLMVSLYSLSENTRADIIDVYFINVSLKNENTEWLKKELDKLKVFRFHLITVNESDFTGAKLSEPFPMESYSRLLLLKVLPEEMDRVLWLDADTVIHNSIDELYETNIDDHSLVAFESINQNIGQKRINLNMSIEQKYFNSGIILFNLDYLRKHYKEDELMNYAISHKEIIEWPDQDVLNALCGSSSIIIDCFRYNYMHFTDTVISDEEFERIRNDNSILHYIGIIKPWDYHYRGKTVEFWIYYAKKSGVYSTSYLYIWNIKNRLYYLFAPIYHKLTKH